MIGYPTFDQLRIFLAVAEEGSFSAAGRRLNRAQSVISYGIAALEEQLGGISLFDRTTRRPGLTAAGRVLLADARDIALSVDGLRARARGLVRGLEGELSIAVDVMLPSDVLTDSLHALNTRYPSVGLIIHVETLGAVAEHVLNGRCAIGISGPLPNLPDSIISQPLGMVDMVPVASPRHPLALLPPAERTIAAARRHVQIVLTDRSRLTEGRDFSVFGLETWRIGDLGAKHALLLAGLGWGNMPAAMVAEDLAQRRLVDLGAQLGPAGPYVLSALHRADAPPGPVGQWLTGRIGAALATSHLTDV